MTKTPNQLSRTTLKAVTACAVLVAILLSAIVFISARPSPPRDITVRHVKSVQSGNRVAATFEITNHTTTRYYVFTLFLEVHDGPVWRKCFDLGAFGPGEVLVAHGVATATFDATNLPTGYPLRLRMDAVGPLTGFSGYFRRLKLWFRGNPVPLNPFDKKTVGSKRTPIFSEEFMEPKP